METVLVIGSTGNIGTAVVAAALRSDRRVLAIVRNQNSADKLADNVGTTNGITFVYADVATKTGIKTVIEQVRSGKLPSFQHVWSSVGAEYVDIPLQDITDDRLDYNMELGFKANFRAYRDTIDYLLEQNNPASTWTICTGTQGELANFPLPAMTQGPLYTMCIAAARETEHTNVRVNEILLGFRVTVDKKAEQEGATTATKFGHVYESLLSQPEIRGCRIRVDRPEDIKQLKHARLF